MKQELMAAALLLSAGAACSAQEYNITDVGSPGGPAQAWAVGPDGLVAGVAAAASGAHNGFVWDGSLMVIPPLAGDTQSHALAVDSAGRVAVVSYRVGGLGTWAMRWENGNATPIGGFAPRGCNAAGDIAGSRETVLASGWRSEEAVLWSGGTLSPLPTLGGDFASAYDVNSRGHVVGCSYAPGGVRPRACIWVNGLARDLGTLGGASAQALAIADAGWVVGVADTAANRPHAFRFRIDSAGTVTERTDLGVLGGESSHAYGVNEAGAVVGISDGRAFLWTGTQPIDLNGTIAPVRRWRLDAAAAINDDGSVVGWGVHDGLPRAFLLTPRGCYADCDTTTGVGTLDIFDFLCFQNRFAQSDSYACDCDTSTGVGVCDVFDFLCFQNAFAGGCR